MLKSSSVFVKSSCKKTKSSMSSLFCFASVVGMFLIVLNVSAQPPAQGANKFLGNITTGGQVRSDFMTYWNQITGENEHKWGSVEYSQGNRNWGGGDAIKNFAEKNDILWKFHTLVWGSQEPGWVRSLSADKQLQAVINWMDAAAARYPNVRMIDVVNEAEPGHAPASFKGCLGGDGSTGYDWIIKSFELARERWPKAILIYNDYNNCEYDGSVNWTYNLVKKMIEVGAPIDAIGCQAHDAFKISTTNLKKNIDKLASLGLPIFITEYDIGESNDANQKNIMEEQFTMMWNHPKIVGITYWGYIVGRTWRNGTGLMQSSGAERPALTWLKNFVKENPNPPNDFPEFLSMGGGGASGFRVTSSTNGLGTITQTPDSASFSEETNVTFTATPLSEDWVFDSWSGDVTGKENPLTVSVTKSIKVVANFVSVYGTSNLIDEAKTWTFRVQSGDATAAVENGEHKVAIKDAGTAPEDIRYYQSGITLEQGKTYKLVFDASADVEKEIVVEVGMTSSPKTVFNDTSKSHFILAKESKLYEMVFKMEEETHQDSRLQFVLGAGSNATVLIKNVAFYEVPVSVIPRSYVKNGKRNISISQKGSLLNININQMNKGGSLVTIYDMLGNVVKSESLKANTGSSRFSLQIGNIPHGHYIVSVRNGNMLETSRIITMGK